MKILLPRWENATVRELLKRDHKIAVVLTEWDLKNQNIDKEEISKVDTQYYVKSIDSLYELVEVSVSEILSKDFSDIVLNVTEYSQLSTAYLSALLGLQPSSVVETSAWSRDKRAMKLRVIEAGIPCAKFASIPIDSSKQDIENTCDNFNFPVIIKPPTGSGSSGVFKLDSVDDLIYVIEGSNVINNAPSLMIEEYVEGTEIHINGIWKNGREEMFAVSRYIEPRLRQTPGGRSGSIYLKEIDHRELYENARNLHSRVNKALNIKHGVTHMEAFISHDGTLVFSEIGTRVPGGAIPEMLFANGIDIRNAWLDVELNEDTVLSAVKQPTNNDKCIGWINIAPLDGPGRIIEEPSDDFLRSFPYVVDIVRVRKKGNDIDKVQPSLWCLMLVIEAENEKAFLSYADEIASNSLDKYVLGS